MCNCLILVYHGFILVYLYVAKNETLGLKQPDMFTFNNAQIGLQVLLSESGVQDGAPQL